jgi:hypothetical protein
LSKSTFVLIAMTTAVAILAVYRNIVARHEDDAVHIADPSGQLVVTQQKLARSLNRADRLGMGLTVATALYGIGLLATWLFAALAQAGRI